MGKKILKLSLIILTFNLGIGVYAGGPKGAEALDVGRNVGTAAIVIGRIVTNFARNWLAGGEAVNAVDNYGRTVVAVGAREGNEGVEAHVEGVGELLDGGADVNRLNNFGIIGLHEAAETGNEVAVRELLDGGADVTAHGVYRRTALHRAAENGHEAEVRALLDGGAAVNAEHGIYRRMALHLAAENGHEAVVRALLLAGGADVNAADNHGRTALHYAAENGHEAVVRALLLAGGADVNAAHDNIGRTALHYAAENGREAVVRALLLDGGAAVDVVDRYGRTALHLAAQRDNVEIVRALLAGGAAVDVMNNYGSTAFVFFGNNPQILLLLLSMLDGEIEGNLFRGYCDQFIRWIQSVDFIKQSFESFIKDMVMWFNERTEDIDLNRFRQMRDGLIDILEKLQEYVQLNCENNQGLLDSINAAVVQLREVNLSSVRVKSARNVVEV